MTQVSEHPAMLDAAVHLEAAIGKAAREAAREARPAVPSGQDVHPVPLLFAIPGASATVDQAGRTGPVTGYWWDVRRIAVSGFTAGTVSVYRNSSDGAVLAKFAQPGEWTWSGQLWLPGNDRLVFVTSSDLAGSVQVDGTMIQVADAWVPLYAV